MSTDFETFLMERVLPEHRPIVMRFCQQMDQLAPELTRRMRAGTENYHAIPAYRGRKDLVVISPTKTGITFSFIEGGRFDDPFAALTGTGKRSKVIRVSKPETYPEDAMAHYIRQAVALDRA